MKNIAFGIDLGTTNSGIAKCENGNVKLLKNPVGFRDILPSVVSFRKGRILVGDKAREQYFSNAGNVFSAFKRKMGSNDIYHVNTSNESMEISPVNLSTYVLRELRNYVSEEEIEAAVITIPASFDTMQSNATKEAGIKAGFSEVVLLQEPIAACLAYANTQKLDIEKEQKWLVYDFGGGTFDSALVSINKRELKVLDNKGNNFLGGIDIDYAFVEHLVVPKLANVLNESDLWTKLLQKNGQYEKLWHYLNYLSEEAKKELSLAQSACIEVDFPEMGLDCEIEISREEFNEVVRPKYIESEIFVRELLSENALDFSDIERIILVGGTTYIPFIKEQLKQNSGVLVDDSIDPTTAVIVGAAYYAGSQPRMLPNVVLPHPNANGVVIKVSFESYSNDMEELIAFKSVKPFTGFYRIIRTDGGYDSGTIAFKDTDSEFVTLMPKTKNVFQLQVFDQKKNLVYQQADIVISQGLYGISGQLLPQDICIELDDKEGTYLDVIFKRNSILPLSKTLYKTFSKSIVKDSDDKIIINVVEGRGGTMPGSNLSIGYIEISGMKIQGDLIEGTDIEIKVSMDESRGLNVQVYISFLDQEINQSFHIAGRTVSVDKALKDIAGAELILKKEIENHISIEEYEFSARLHKIVQELDELKIGFKLIEKDQITEEKYRLDERKRRLLSELDSCTRGRDLFREILAYKQQKEVFKEMEAYVLPEQMSSFKVFLAKEKEVIESGDKHLVKRTTEELKKLNNKIYLQNDQNYIGIFLEFRMLPATVYQSNENIEELLIRGDEAIVLKNYVLLKQLINILIGKLKPEYLQKAPAKLKQRGDISGLKMGVK